MRKLYTYLLFIVQTTPFAFWKLEGPFIAQISKNNNTYTPFKKYIYDHETISAKYFYNLHALSEYIVFYYDQNTHYLFSFSSTNKADVLEKNLFFLSNQEVFSNDKKFFLTQAPLLSFQKYSGMSLIISGIIPFSPISSMISSGSPLVTQSSTFFLLNERIVTDSGVEIINPVINKDKNIEFPIIVSKNKKQTYFQNALIKYFHCDNHYTALATAITQSNYIDSKKPFVYNLRKIVNNITKVNKSEINKLNNSTILSVYGVVKGKDNKNSIVFGLAQDNTTENKERFFWFTDLENDISTLIDY